MKYALSAFAALAIFAGTAFAQTTPAKPVAPVVPAKPAVTAPVVATPAPASADDKQAKSKACSAQADAKGLHGKERKKFREECKKAA